MKKNVILTVISLLALLTPLPGSVLPVMTEGALRPDIWIYRGHYAMFDAGRASLTSSELEELRGAFLKETSSLRDAGAIDADHPLAGRLSVCDIFVLDDTVLYFENAELPVGGLYGFCDITIMSGSLDALAASSAGDVFIAPGARLSVGGEISTGGAFECFGGAISAGTISADSIWLDSSGAPLTVMVAGNVFTGFYTQSGGSVTVGGGLFCQSFGERYDGALITVNCEYSRYGAAYLNVRGDVVAMGDHGGVEVGGGSKVGGFDEASLRMFEAERSELKGMLRGAYEASGGAYEDDASRSDVTFIVGGELRSIGSAVFYEGVGG